MKTPSFNKSWNAPNAVSSKLKEKLDDKEILEFYEISTHTLNDLFRKNDKNDKIENIKENLLLRYLIASAPFINLQTKENVMWAGNKGDLDIQSKSYVIHCLNPEKLINMTPLEEREHNITKKEALDIFFSSMITVLKQFRSLYDPNFEEKEKKATEDGSANPEIMGDEATMVFYFNRLSIQGRRNFKAKGLIEEIEKDLIPLLIKFYPTKAATVKKYLSEAGYTDKEMPFLLDRTIGRVPSARYLYKSLPKRKKTKF